MSEERGPQREGVHTQLSGERLHKKIQMRSAQLLFVPSKFLRLWQDQMALDDDGVERLGVRDPWLFLSSLTTTQPFCSDWVRSPPTSKP